MAAGEVYFGMKDPVSKVTDPPLSEFTKFLAVSSAFFKAKMHTNASCSQDSKQSKRSNLLSAVPSSCRFNYRKL
jgi:hypothetical protein